MKKKFLILLSVLVMCAAALGLVGCKKAKELIYPAPENIAYDGQYITWTKVDNANHYTVAINGGEAARSNSTTYAYASTDTFEVTVTAVFDHAEQSTSVTFKPLTPIAAVNIGEDGAIHWDAVAGATAYAVSLNGTETEVTDTQFVLPEGSNRVKVKPIVSGDSTFYSSYSAEVNAYVYAAPASVKYDGTALTWTGSASDYLVTVNGTANTVKGNSYAFSSGNKDFTVEVKAIGNHTSTFDSKAVSEDFHYLDAITEIFVEDGIVKWNAIDGAEGYKLKIGGVVQKAGVTETQYENLATGRSQDVAVMPYNDSGNYFSSWSAEKTVYILDTPQVSWNSELELDGEANNNLTWNAVNAAAGYTVRLCKDGGAPVISDYSDVQRAFAHAYAEVGVYTVEVKTNAETGSADHYDSRYSAPITVERLAAPRAADSEHIVSNRDSLAAGFTVNFVPVNGASGYQLYKDGVLLPGKFTTGAALSDTNVVEAASIEGKNLTYKVRSMGGVKTVGTAKYVTLPCLTSAALSFGITVQATPQDPVMSGYTLSWTAASENGYTVAYGGTVQTAQQPNYNLSTLKAGSYSVTVAARGNGGSVLASNPSAPVAIQRLEAPKNIKITRVGNGTLHWDDVSNAKSYEAYLGLDKTPVASSTFGNMYQYIDTDGTTLSMTAVANYYNNAGTLYYMTSETSPTQQFVRLAAPTFPSGALADSSKLVWNKPGNTSLVGWQEKYEIYKTHDEMVTGGIKTKPEHDISYLESGSDNTFYVKAIGDETMYLDSDFSVVKNVHKLATPTLRTENGKYVWSGVSLASTYYLEIDGKKASDDYHTSQSTYEYTPRFTTEGDHIVKLWAVGDGNNQVNSAAYTYTQKVRVLSAPRISYRYSSDAFIANGSIIVDVTTPSPNCAGYQYEVAGTSSETVTATTYSKEVASPGKYTVRVKAVGGTFDSANVYYIDSQYAGGSAADTITIYAAPSGFKIVDGTLKWDAISGVKKYEYEITYTDGTVVTDETGYSNVTVEKGKSFTIRVRCKGEGDKIIASAWAEWNRS